MLLFIHNKLIYDIKRKLDQTRKTKKNRKQSLKIIKIIFYYNRSILNDRCSLYTFLLKIHVYSDENLKKNKNKNLIK